MSHSVSLPAATLAGLPQSDHELDAFIARESWFDIDNVSTIERLLLRAAERFHMLDALMRCDTSDTSWTVERDRTWSVLHQLFCSPIADLRMFFSETAGFHELPASERKRLYQIADVLVGSGRDAIRLNAAKALSTPFTGSTD